jgi:hypothetical protein
MNRIPRRLFLRAALGAGCGLAVLCPGALRAQLPWPFVPQQTPDAQRSALEGVRSQVNWLLNATRTAPSYGAGGYEVLWQQFQALRGAYSTFTSTLTPAQVNAGANELAELGAGLDILQEAFGNYQKDLAARRSPAQAMRSLCQVMAQGSRVWMQELNRCSTRLRVGFP